MDAGNRPANHGEFRVRTGLDEVVLRRAPTKPGEHRFVERTRHARTERVVEIEREGEAFQVLPEVGDPWEPLTVHARLHRLADAYRRIPHTPDTKPMGYLCGMPEPVREPWKDAAKDKDATMTLPVTSAEHAAADALLDLLIALTDEQRLLAWGLACRLPNRKMSKHLHCDHRTVGKRKLEVLDMLVARLNASPHRPDGRDVEGARSLIHRNIK